MSPVLATRERPALAHAVSDMMNAARSPELPHATRATWTRAAPPPSSFNDRMGHTSPSLDNVHNTHTGMNWAARELDNVRDQREREWRAREHALNLEQRELELERARMALQREHQQYEQFTGSSGASTSTGVSRSTGMSGTTNTSGTTGTSGTTHTSGTTSMSGTTAVSSGSGTTIGMSHIPFGRRPASPESIPDDTRPPWATSQPKASNARYSAQLRDESDAESGSGSPGKKGTWMGRGLRRLSMPAPFLEKKQIQVVSIPAPRGQGIENRRSFDAGR